MDHKSRMFRFLPGMDRIGFFGSLRNKLTTIRSYNCTKHCRNLHSRQDFIQAVLNLSSSISDLERPIARASRLWQMERISRAARFLENGSFLLKDPTLERYKPILHVGWGMDVIAETGFDFQSLSRIIEKSADPKYRLMVYEAAGIISIAAALPLRSALIGIPVPRSFNLDGLEKFIRFIDRPEMDMMSHGFGRGLYFRKFTLRSSLHCAISRPHLFHPGVAVKGVGFAFAMVNCRCLQEVFFTADRLREDKIGGEVVEFFREGVATAVSFLEWNFPGLLGTLGAGDITRIASDKLRSYRKAGGVFSFFPSIDKQTDPPGLI